jgi:opacity protein-like surface antigen
MKRVGFLAAVAALMLALVAAGAAGSASSLPLTQRVITFAGMRSSTTPSAVTSVAAWAKSDTSISATKLRAWGFAGGIGDQLDTPGNSNRYGLSLVVKLSSQANAAAYLKRLYTTNGPWTRFSVGGIPGAVGFEEDLSSQGGSNVGFTAGPYAYLVGVGWQGGSSNEIPNKTLIAAAQQLHKRVS